MKRLLIIITVLFTTVTFAQKGNTWAKKNYNVSGNWSVETNNGKTFLILSSDFKTSKGPDLKIFITKKSNSTISKNEAVEKYGVLLGPLKSYKGAQKYLIPAGVAISDYKTIVIHCEKYTKVWGVASIQ